MSGTGSVKNHHKRVGIADAVAKRLLKSSSTQLTKSECAAFKSKSSRNREHMKAHLKKRIEDRLNTIVVIDLWEQEVRTMNKNHGVLYKAVISIKS